jgi:hypothetical protein
MSSRTIGIVAVLMTVAAWGEAGAYILNGDFEDPSDLAHWVAVPIGDLGMVTVEEITGASDQLHLAASNSYTWSGAEWLLTDGETGSIAMASNPLDYDLYAPSGTTALSFDAKVAIASIAGDDAERILVEVSYNFDGGMFGSTESLWLAEGDWAQQSMSLPGLDTSKKMNITVYARSGDGLTGEAGIEQGQTADLIAEGWFDNFAFVPEPASMLLLAVGGCAMVLRRRR